MGRPHFGTALFVGGVAAALAAASHIFLSNGPTFIEQNTPARSLDRIDNVYPLFPNR